MARYWLLDEAKRSPRPRRPLSVEENDRKERLQKIWARKKRELKLTLEQAARQCGWQNASNLGHYIKGRQPLNWNAIVKIATVLQVDVEDIWPGMREEVIDALNMRENLLEVLLGRQKMAVVELIDGLTPEQLSELHSYADYQRAKVADL